MNDNQDLGTEAMNLANALHAVLIGHSTAAGFIAISMVLGHMESLAKTPDIDRTMELLRKGIVEERDRQIARRRTDR